MKKAIAVGIILLVVVVAITWYVFSPRPSPVIVGPKIELRQSVHGSRVPQDVNKQPLSDVSNPVPAKKSEVILAPEQTNSTQETNHVSFPNMTESNIAKNHKTETEADIQPMNAVSQNRALEIARGAILKTKYASTLPITIEDRNGQYRVKFPVDKSVPPGSRYRGPDYAAEVYIDKQTGKVLEVHVGD